MNKVILRELEKIKVKDLQYDEKTTHILIPKKEVEDVFVLGKSYLVKLEEYIVNEPPNFTLSSNWNKGVKPKSNHLLIFVLDCAGKMIKVMARDFDFDTNVCLEGIYNELWLPVSSLHKISEIS